MVEFYSPIELYTSAYAERHPHQGSEIVIVSVTAARRSEIDWLYRGVVHFALSQRIGVVELVSTEVSVDAVRSVTH